MNQISSPLTNTSLSSGTDTASVITSVHLVWIVVLMLVVIAGIVHGSRVKARRDVARRAVERHREEAGVAPVAPAVPDGEIAPATAPVADPVVDAGAASGPVTQLKGLGPKVAARLAELGIASVGDLAALDDDGARALDEGMGPFKGRLERDRWIEQARFLAAGDVKGFEAVFGRL